MQAYDDYLANETDKYLEGCKNYDCEIARSEHCESCNHLCEEFLELQDNEWLVLKSMDEIEYREAKSFLFSKLNLEELLKEIHKRSQKIFKQYEVA
jgi:methionyl-tRNA synthetase